MESVGDMPAYGSICAIFSGIPHCHTSSGNWEHSVTSHRSAAGEATPPSITSSLLLVSPAIAGVRVLSSTLGRRTEGINSMICSYDVISCPRAPGLATATASPTPRISTPERGHLARSPLMSTPPVPPPAQRFHAQWGCSLTRPFSSFPIAGSRCTSIHSKLTSTQYPSESFEAKPYCHGLAPDIDTPNHRVPSPRMSTPERRHPSCSSRRTLMRISPVLAPAQHLHAQWGCSSTRSFSSFPTGGPRPYLRSDFGATYTSPYLRPYDYHVQLVERIPDDVPIVGEIYPITPQLSLKEEAKPYCHGLILDIDNLNRQGYSLLEPLTPDHVLVDGHGKLCLMDGILIKPRTLTSTSTDFMHCSYTLKKLLLRTARPEDSQLSFSPDFLEWCSDLENPLLVKAYPQIYPSCLLPLHLRGKAYMDIYDYMFFVCPHPVSKAVSKNAPYRQKWKEIADGNKVIRPYFDIKRVDLRCDRSYLGFWRVIRCHVFIHRDRVYFSIDALERLLQFKTPLLMPTLCKRLWAADGRLANIMFHRLFLYPTISPHPDHLILRRVSLF